MKVDELIKELRTVHPDTRVLVYGYEDGFDEVTNLKIVKVNPQTQKAWYNGTFDESSNGENALLVFNKERVHEK